MRLRGFDRRMFSMLMTLASLGLQLGLAQSVAPKPVPMARYSDPDGDVSFEYPAVWSIDKGRKFYLSPQILQGDRVPRMQVIFSPAGNYYAKTNLLGLDFVYVKEQAPSAEACTRLAMGDTPTQPTSVSMNGVPFLHFDQADAGMCHGIDQHVYWTYRQSAGGGACYLFEEDMHTSCSGAYPGQRDLTEREKRALNRHLNAIPQSIQFSKPK